MWEGGIRGASCGSNMIIGQEGIVALQRGGGRGLIRGVGDGDRGHAGPGGLHSPRWQESVFL